MLIGNQLMNQCTEVVVPFIVDRFLSAAHKKEQEDNLEMDKLRAQRRLPPFPVSPCKMCLSVLFFSISLRCARLPWFLCICALGGRIRVGCICVTVLICLANKGHNAVQIFNNMAKEEHSSYKLQLMAIHVCSNITMFHNSLGARTCKLQSNCK